MILDCGISVNEVKKAIGYNVSKIKFALCTHIHNDHAAFVKKYLNMGIKVIMPRQVVEKHPGFVNAITATPMSKMHIDEYTIIPFDVPHDEGVECLAYIVEHSGFGKFLYMTDCMYCRYNLSKLKIRHVLCECNYFQSNLYENYEEYTRNRVLKTHMDVETCKSFLKVNKTDALKNVILCHLSADNSDSVEMKRQVREVVGENVRVEIAKKGLVLNLNE